MSLPSEVIAYRNELNRIGGEERLTSAVHAQRRRLMAEGKSEAEARRWVLRLGFKHGVEPWEIER